ncbi:MAG: transglutaminase family protein [Acidobacteriaceae bacterium]
MLRFAFALLAAMIFSSSALPQTEAERHFQFHYKFEVRNLSPGQQVRIWFPRAVSDEWQTVRLVSAQSDLPLQQKREPEYGDAIYFAEAPKATKRAYSFDVLYDVMRREHKADLTHTHDAHLQRTERTRYLQADKLVPVEGLPAQIAQNQTSAATTTLGKARALYQYTLANMKYDKSGTGWGRGDTMWACDAKRGNCTDFHSLFISMARSQGIPSYFEIGFSVPATKHEAQIPGYHCWAEFFDPQHGWVPVDISEAWKDQTKREYFCGAHDANRIQFSRGRDITLAPKQAGEPLNYFVYPYVEVAGKKWENVANDFSFSDVTSVPNKGTLVTGK